MSQPWRGQIPFEVASGSCMKTPGQFSRWRRSNHSLWSGGSWTAWNNPPQTHSICPKYAKPGSKANSWLFSRGCGWRRGSVNKAHLIESPLLPFPATDYTGLKSFFYCKQKKKCFPCRQLSAPKPPLHLSRFTSTGWTACRAVRGKRGRREEEAHRWKKKGKRAGDVRMRSAKLLPEEETRRKTQFTVKTQAL